jgi:uncharacterized membrane protein YkoI
MKEKAAPIAIRAAAYWQTADPARMGVGGNLVMKQVCELTAVTDLQEGWTMNATTRSLVAAVLFLGLLQASVAAQRQGAVPIREQTTGLLAQAQFPAAPARLKAMAQVPGARIAAATIERRTDRLVYSFDLEYPDDGMVEHVQIDATSGEIILVEYCIEVDDRGRLHINAAPELVAEAKVGFVAARETALAEVANGRLIGSVLRVQPTGHLYVFDIEVSRDSVIKQVLVDAYSGHLVSVQP